MIVGHEKIIEISSNQSPNQILTQSGCLLQICRIRCKKSLVKLREKKKKHPTKRTSKLSKAILPGKTSSSSNRRIFISSTGLFEEEENC